MLTIASKDQLFQFNDDLCEQIDNVAMGSPVIRTTNGKHIYHYAPSRINLQTKTNFPTSTGESSMLFSLLLVPGLTAAIDFFLIYNGNSFQQLTA